MATWFATASGNINSAGRWNSAPDGSGTTLTWPPASGDILVSNDKTITVNVSVDLGATGYLRSDNFDGATGSGYFTASAGVTITANLGLGGLFGYVLTNNSGGTVTLVGNIDPPVQANYFGFLQQAGTTNIVGSAVGGTASNAYAINNSSATGTVNVTGTVTGGSGGTAVGIHNANPGTITVTGTATGGTTSSAAGIRNQAGGTAILTGNAIAATGPGIFNNAAGPFTVTGYVQASTTQAGATNSAQGVLTVGETRSASNGRGAVLGAFRYASTTAAKNLPIINGSQKTLSVLDVAALVPAVEDVRAGVTYGDGVYTGTLALQRKRQTMAGRF